MNKDNITKLLKLLKANNVDYSEEWVKCSCLFAKHTHKSGKDSNPSAGLFINSNGVSGYSCFSCHKNFHTIEAMLGELAMLNMESGFSNLDVNQAIQFVGDEDVFSYDGTMEFEDTHKKEFNAFPEQWLDSFSKACDVQAAVDYLISRSVPEQVCLDFDLRFDHAKQMIGFPYKSATGKLAGMRGRSIEADAPKAKWHHDYSYEKKNNTSLVWYRESELDATKPLIVVEGEFDCSRVYQLYRNVTALLTSGASEKKLQKLTYFPEVFWLTDNDKAGDDSRKQAKTFFSKTATGYHDIKLPEEFKDPAEMKALILKYTLKTALEQYVTLDEFISE